jgi:predicted ArsR family transcriptional regulator
VLEVIDILAELGGLAEMEDGRDALVLQGYSCPFAEALPGHPEVCSLAVRFLEELLGRPVAEQCTREPTPRCRFRVASGPD